MVSDGTRWEAGVGAGRNEKWGSRRDDREERESETKTMQLPWIKHLVGAVSGGGGRKGGDE